MSAATEPVAAAAAPKALPRVWWRGRLGVVAAVIVGMVVAFLGWKNTMNWPNALVWNSLPGYLDRFQIWLSNSRNEPHPSFVFAIFNGVANFLDNIVSWTTTVLLDLTWVGTTALTVLVVLRFGGRRQAAIMAVAFTSFAAMGLWQQTVETFALVLAAVTLSLLIGMPLGVLAARSNRFHKAITPVLDAMQIVPAFAYLMPVVILFSVGPGAAVVTTMIFAMPPAIRITELGIRGVPGNTVEAASAMGATRWQTIAKVQLPLARRMLLLAVNQTILFALSMVVIAGLIGGQGLGDVVTNGLYSNPALALLGGAAIVILAITLDRSTEAMANKTDPARSHLGGSRRRKGAFTAVCAVAIGLAVLLGHVFHAGSTYQRWTAQGWLLGYVQKGLDYVQNPSTFVFHITSPVGDFLVSRGLEPLRSFFVETPWPVMTAGLVVIAFLLAGARPALTLLAMLFLIGLVGEWTNAMDTASQVLVATGIVIVVGVVLGVAAAEYKPIEVFLRPINDVFQTLPQLVYIIPFIYLVPVSKVPGLVASVLYAVPAVIRLVSNGIKEVPAETVEAARAFGATERQVLLKVKVPLAGRAIMLGINQGIIMVLSVVVIAGLVGSGALGYDVAQGLQRNQFGQGVLASVAILALGIGINGGTRGRRQARAEL